MTISSLRRGPAATRFAVAALAVASTLLVLPACKRDPAPPPKVEDPARQPTDPDSYPIRLLLVLYRKDSTNPKLPPRTEAEALARAQEARAKILAPGGSFGAVAKEMSDEPVSAADDGFLGFIAEWANDPPSVVKAVRALKEGEVSEPIATAFGQQLIQRLSRAEGKALEEQYAIPLDGVVAPWHDLVKTLPDTFTKDASYEAATKVIMDLRAGAYPMPDVPGHVLGGKPTEFVIRRGTSTGFELVFAAVSAMKAGDISDPIETRDGWLIARRLPYVRCYVRHIVITHDTSPKLMKPVERSREDAAKIAEDTLAKLRRDPKEFDRLVKEVSEESGSRFNGGFAGDVCNVVPQGAARAIPEFLSAVLKLKPGEISEIVESRFGFHIIRRED